MGKEIDFSDVRFDDFRRMALDVELSCYQKIGFPDSYRAGYELAIFEDICSKLGQLQLMGRKVLDIGPGCTQLPHMLIDHCVVRNQKLFLIDNAEMLDQLPINKNVEKIPGFFPDCPLFIEANRGSLDVILCYSVLQYVAKETSLFSFLDCCCELLAPGGQLLIGDVPNISKRKRFFASDVGVAFHRNFMKTDDMPLVRFNQLENGHIDDAVVISLLSRARASGFDAYVLPQRIDLPMANRREDILITRN